MLNNSHPLVSIVTPCFNGDRYLAETIESVKRQTFENWELIVVDDASKDRTPSILNKYSKADPRIISMTNPQNAGAAVTRNRAISSATGKYLAFLDADDLWENQKLEEHLKFMEEIGCSMSFTPYRIMTKDGRDSGREIDTHAPTSVDYQAMLKKEATMGCSTVILNRELLPKIEMPNLRTGQDYALWLSLLRRGAVSVKFPKPLTRYRITPGSISRNKLRKASRQWQIYRDFEGLGVFRSSWYFVNYAVRAIVR